MANALYDKGRQAFLEGGIAWLTDNIKAVLVDTGAYTPDIANHQFLADIAAGARISTSGNFTTKTSATGVADADDAAFSSVPNTSIEALVIYQDTGSAATSKLIAYIDVATGLPVQTNLGSITVLWDNGPNKIFKL